MNTHIIYSYIDMHAKHMLYFYIFYMWISGYSITCSPQASSIVGAGLRFLRRDLRLLSVTAELNRAERLRELTSYLRKQRRDKCDALNCEEHIISGETTKFYRCGHQITGVVGDM